MDLKARDVTDERVNVVMEFVSSHVFDCSDIFCEKVDGEGNVRELRTPSMSSRLHESRGGCAP
jgi:hypothetical protein